MSDKLTWVSIVSLCRESLSWVTFVSHFHESLSWVIFVSHFRESPSLSVKTSEKWKDFWSILLECKIYMTFSMNSEKSYEFQYSLHCQQRIWRKLRLDIVFGGFLHAEKWSEIPWIFPHEFHEFRRDYGLAVTTALRCKEYKRPCLKSLKEVGTCLHSA